MSAQIALKLPGQPPARWRAFMLEAHQRISSRKRGFKMDRDPIEQIADEIIANGDSEAFLKAVRRGRGTHLQNTRYQLLRYVEAKAGAGVARRRPDSNTPDALALRKVEPAELWKGEPLPIVGTKVTKSPGHAQNFQRRKAPAVENTRELSLE